jgi:hypothetical protein
VRNGGVNLTGFKLTYDQTFVGDAPAVEKFILAFRMSINASSGKQQL